MIPIELPFPSQKLFPNHLKGRHYTSSLTARTIERQTAELLAKAWRKKTGFEPRSDAKYGVYVLFQPNIDNKDLDNCLAALKPALDGVASALGVNDRLFRPITVDAKSVGTRTRQSVLVTIEEWTDK